MGLTFVPGTEQILVMFPVGFGPDTLGMSLRTSEKLGEAREGQMVIERFGKHQLASLGCYYLEYGIHLDKSQGQIRGPDFQYHLCRRLGTMSSSSSSESEKTMPQVRIDKLRPLSIKT